MTERNRPRIAATVDPVIAAYLRQSEVNSSRVIDLAVRKHVSDDYLEQAARDAGLTREDTELVGLELPEAEGEE